MAALDQDNALQFAVMLQSGLPPADAILYFTESDDPAEVQAQLSKWMRSRLVKQASASLMKRPWTQMALDERCRFALDQHYSQLAYLLHSEHYGEADAARKTKLDTARTALEAKLAGMAGKTNALEQFLQDLRDPANRRISRPVAERGVLNVGPAD
jgi:hypothetical protein